MLYVAVSVLQTYTPVPGIIYPKHDLLDDMESHYYILYTTMVAQLANGTLIQPQSKMFEDWASKTPRPSIHAKKTHISSEEEEESETVLISTCWSRAIMDALQEWRSIIAEVHAVKKGVFGLNSNAKIDRLSRLTKDTFHYYKRMMNALDAALKAMALKMGVDIPEPLPIPGPLTIKLRPLPQNRRLFSDPVPARAVGAATSQSTRGGRKRPSVNVDDPESPLKGRRLRVSQSGMSTESRGASRQSRAVGSSKLRD